MLTLGRLSTQWREFLPMIAAMLAGAAVCAQVVVGTRDVWHRAPVVAPSVVATPLSTELFEALARGHLFGSAAAAASDAPASQGPLKLSGTIAFDDPKQGYGLIAEGGTPGRLYRVGENLPGGATLHEVYAQKVIVEHEGRFETLELSHAVLAGVLRSSDDSPSNVTVRRKIPKTVMPVTAIRLPEKFDPSRLPNVVAKTPLLRALRPAPLLMDGYLIGYRLTMLGGRVSLPGVGPQSVIVAVNGVKLEDGASAEAAFEALSTEKTATLALLTPDGGTRTVTVDTSGLASAGRARALN